MFRRHTEARRPALPIRIDGVATEARDAHRVAAAGLCARAGLATVLLDEQAAPGGQVYRGVTASPLGTNTVLGPDYWRGEALAREALTSDLHYVPGANVWGLLREGEIAVSLG